MPYLLVAQVALAWLLVQYVRSANASSRGKYILCGITIVSFLALWLWPTMFIPAVLLQLALGVYLAFHRLVVRPDPSSSLVRRR